MKHCPVCNQTYTDENLNFCLNDGELLRLMASEPRQQRSFLDDSPPTVLLNETRVTNPASWQAPSSPPATWQQPSQLQNPQFGTLRFAQPLDQTLPIISLALGILSFLMVCCY